MPSNGTLLDILGLLAAVVVTLVDGRRAIVYASLAAAIGLAPTVATVYGGDGALLVLVAAALVVAAAPVARVLGQRQRGVAGMDPRIPVVGAGEGLFGPRSIRTAGILLVLPAASWVSSNVPLGLTATIKGVLFPAAVVWGCGCMRLLTARTLDDLALGGATSGIAAAAAWLVAGGADAMPSAAAAAALAPGAAIAVAWLGGRHLVPGRAAKPAP